MTRIKLLGATGPVGEPRVVGTAALVLDLLALAVDVPFLGPRYPSTSTVDMDLYHLIGCEESVADALPQGVSGRPRNRRGCSQDFGRNAFEFSKSRAELRHTPAK
jgi:hypothetical protein